MNLQKQIELENLKLDMLSQAYEVLEKPKTRDKISFIKYLGLPKKQKLFITQNNRLEKAGKKLSSLLEYQKELIKKLEYKKARYDIYFPKKEKPSSPSPSPSSSPSIIFHHDQTKGYSVFLHPIKSFQKWKWGHFNKETTILINMELDNNKHISFIRPIENTSFSIFDRTYIIDLNLAYPSLSAGMSCLDYHQSFSIPIRRRWDIDGIKTAIEQSGIIDCPAATNPSLITRFINSNIIEQIFNGAALQQMLFIIMIIGIVNFIVVTAMIIIFFVKFGALEKLIGGK